MVHNSTNETPKVSLDAWIRRRVTICCWNPWWKSWRSHGIVAGWRDVMMWWLFSDPRFGPHDTLGRFRGEKNIWKQPVIPIYKHFSDRFIGLKSFHFLLVGTHRRFKQHLSKDDINCKGWWVYIVCINNIHKTLLISFQDQ